MDQNEKDLLEKYAQTDAELKEVWDDHVLYDKQVTKLENKGFRTPTEEQTLKQLKKQKLEAKTRLMAMLDNYRAAEKS